MYDLVIKNGKIIDGTGNPPYLSDIAISEGKIRRIAKGIEGGSKVIDAAGLVVTPGFIDSHSHSDNAMLEYPDQTEKIEQGITTSIGGQCGSSLAPISKDVDPATAKWVGDFGKSTDIYRTMGAFLEIGKDVPLGSNLVTFVGHGSLRRATMGIENRAPSKEELDEMKELLRDGLEHGAIGISFGLFYTPGCYAQTEELIELAKVVAEYKGMIAAHIRDEGDFLAKSTEEFIRVVRESGVGKGVISHHKSLGMENWGKVTHTLRMIDEANEEGLEIYCDVYPYTAYNTGLSAEFIPKELRADGFDGLAKIFADPDERAKLIKGIRDKNGNDMSRVLITGCRFHPEYDGKSVPEIAKMNGRDECETILDLIRDSGDNCDASFFGMCEEDVETVLAHKRAMICTDSSIAKGRLVYHPRLCGTFPRVLGRYVRERKVTSLPEMIRKMTSLPATVYELKSKGLLAEGFDADLCIFDPKKIIDRAEYTDCSKKAEGLNYVILSGEVVVENAVYNGKRMGKLILHRYHQR
ncbi:MAG: D-aminoacylase [Clostridia bacterium]|nr:D-aminoacylase [Clostridia bacterium]